MNKFGIEIVSPEEQNNLKEKIKKFAIPNEDGATNVMQGGYYGYYLDLDATLKNDSELIEKYRDAAAQPEVDGAIENIVNDAIVRDDNGQIVKLDMDQLDLTEGTKKKIAQEFDYILELLEFSNKATDIFRNWYVDGRIFYQIAVDKEDISKGIINLDWIDARKIKKVRRISKTADKETGVMLTNIEEEFYVFSEDGLGKVPTTVTNNIYNGVKISKDSVAYVTSGILSPKRNQVWSYLHKALKPANQLRIVEDAVVIYRLSRAPERRLFYIDVGAMSTQKANEYVKSIQQSFKNKLVYDTVSGEIRGDVKFMSMLEDFWLPRREGGRGTEISTLPGGQALDQIADIEYFQKKLYKSLNVPESRLLSETGFTFGRTTEITQDELLFANFVAKLRNKFCELFDVLLGIHLSLKNICTIEDWKTIRNKINFKFTLNNNFEELKKLELLTERLNIVDRLQPYVGIYFPRSYVKKTILRMDDDEIAEMEAEMEADLKKYGPPPSMMMGMPPGGDGGMPPGGPPGGDGGSFNKQPPPENPGGQGK